ncbi:MAG: type IV pilin protein [Methylotetracoccus sp.]
MSAKKRSAGFTLIELMITVAVVAILATIAVPSYTGQLAKTRRAEAQGCLMELMSFMERFYTQYGSYQCTATIAGLCSGTGASPTLPFTQAPKDSTGKVYNLALQSNTGSTYTLRATPITGSAQATDGLMELDNVGVRRWDKNNDGSFGTGETTWAR